MTDKDEVIKEQSLLFDEVQHCKIEWTDARKVMDDINDGEYRQMENERLYEYANALDNLTAYLRSL